ncbi:hypothetical protein [Streptodolium elevatio]|uniref:Lipoprotein n=1 Tax=Streptodolium elevatio TaxID=3157996 RepID=A0ABV3D821_9ACTN
MLACTAALAVACSGQLPGTERAASTTTSSGAPEPVGPYGTGAAPPAPGLPAPGVTATHPSVWPSTEATPTYTEMHDDHDHGGETPAPLPTPSVPVAAQVDGNDPLAVSKAAVITMLSSDTTTDSSAADAVLRAGVYFTPEFLADMRGVMPGVREDPQWPRWKEHQVRMVVEAELADDMGKPPNTEVEAYHAWSVTTRPVGADGYKGVPEEDVLFVTMKRAMPGKPWLVSDIEYS